MAGQIRERVRVHERGRARQAGMAEGVERERFYLRGGNRFLVLLLQRGLLDVARRRRGRENLFGFRIGLPHVELRRFALRHWDRASRVFRLAEADMKRTIAEFVPAQPEAFLGA